MKKNILITDEEIQAAIDKLKKGKASDNNGIRAEDIKTCDNETKEMIKRIFDEVLKQESCTSEIWRRIRIKVIHKKGNEELVGNYRRICTLPALYKLFSTILYNRLYPRLHQMQSEDHLATYRMIEQKCHEWRVKCGLRRLTSSRHLTPLATTQYGTPSKPVALSKTTSTPSITTLHGRPRNLWYRT